jgi:hypothetical protein
MRHGLLARLALTVAVTGCQDATPRGESTAANVSSPASECNVADTFSAPNMTLTDLSGILQKVIYFSSSPATFAQLFDGSWTNWYKADMGTALAKLATMRSVLDKYNLHDTYLPGTRPQVDCTDKSAVRQADGTCNDLVNTTAGAVGTRIGRNIPIFVPNPAAPGTYMPNKYAYPAATTAELLSPNPREVSRKLFTRPDTGIKKVPFLNLLAAAWIQFQVHDWFGHGDNSPTEFFRLPLAPDDMLRRYQVTELLIPKTTRDMSAFGYPLPPVYKNEVTHWWDGSQIYGSSADTANSLRARGAGGELKAELAIDAKGLLPVASDGFEQTGMRRNWWIGLGLMHNLFAKEHNAVVANLRASHPELDEQQLFDKARMITAAVLAKIHTVEWTPAILPNRTATVGLNANWSGLKTYLDPYSTAALPQFMAGMAAQITATSPDPQTAAVRIGTAKAAVMGVLGGDTNNHGVPYSLTEEFVSVYRMHPLLPDQVKIRQAGSGNTLGVFKTEQTRNSGSRLIEEAFGMGNVIYSFGTQNPGALVLGNYPRFIQQLQLPFGPMDMGAVDVLRDRERGLPRYNDFRVQLRLPPVASIEALTDDPAFQAALHEVYGNDADAINRVDALVGTFAESTRPSCYGFGETLFQVFTEMATRRLQADRFYTASYNAETYTAEGLQWINNASMKAVLLRHYGTELQNTGLANVQNAFYPWEPPSVE